MSYKCFKWVVKCALLKDALLSCVTTENPSRMSQQEILRSQNEYESGGEFSFNVNNQQGDGAGLFGFPEGIVKRGSIRKRKQTQPNKCYHTK